MLLFLIRFDPAQSVVGLSYFTLTVITWVPLMT